MKRLLWIGVVGLAVASGCERKVVVPATSNDVAVKESSLTDAQKIALLRSEAHKRGWKWRIFCTNWESDPHWQFQANAWMKGTTEPGVAFFEDGLRDWKGEPGSTQADAAYKLYLNLRDGGHSIAADHRPDLTTAGKHKMCPPELKGE